MPRTSRFFWPLVLAAIPWLLSLALALRLVFVLFGFDGLYGQDAYEYARFATNLSQYLAGSAELSEFFWPMGYPMTMVIVGWLPLIGNPVLGGQVVSLLAGASIPAAVGIATRRLGGSPWAAAFSASVAATSGLLWVSSAVVMSDALAAALIAWSIALLAQTPSLRRTLCFSLLAASCAVAVRWSILPLALVLASWSLVRHHHAAQSNNTRSPAGLAVPILMFALPLTASAALLTQRIGFGILANTTAWRLSNFWDSSFPGALQNIPPPNVLFYLLGPIHPSLLGLFFLLPLGALMVWRQNRATSPTLWLLLGFLSVTLVASGYPLRNPRFLLPALPLLSVACGLALPTFFPVRQRIGRARSLLLVGFLTVLLLNGWLAESRLQERLARKHSIQTTIDEVAHHFAHTGPSNPELWTFELSGPLNYTTNLDIHDLYLEQAQRTASPLYLLLRPALMVQSTLRWRTTQLHTNLDRFREEGSIEEVPLPSARDSGYSLYRLRWLASSTAASAGASAATERGSSSTQ